MNTYLTVDEVMERLNVSKSMVNRLIDEGRLPALDLNAGRGKKQRKLRVCEADLEKFIANGAVTPKAKQASRRRTARQQMPEKEYV